MSSLSELCCAGKDLVLAAVHLRWHNIAHRPGRAQVPQARQVCCQGLKPCMNGPACMTAGVCNSCRCRHGTLVLSGSANYWLRLRRWFLASNAIFAMHFAVALLCTIGLWAMLVIFSMRLRQALTSGKAWSRRRRSGCIYAYTLSIIQVTARRSALVADAENTPKP